MRTAPAMRAVVIAVTLVAAVVTRHAGLAQGLQRGGTPQTDRVTPVNSAATPHRYQIIRDWGQLTIERRNRPVLSNTEMRAINCGSVTSMWLSAT